MNIRTVTLLSCMAIFTGCANLDSIHRDLAVDSGTGALIDVKQRAILVSRQKASDDANPHSVICAEPSPDALSAYAAQLAIEGKSPQGFGGTLAASSQESAAYIGLRTQSIQVLRDWMYRNCEAYMSGAIDKDEFDILMRRSQKYMVALIGIEQLTGVVKVPTVVINTSGSASASASISSMREDIKANEDKIASLEADKAKLSDAEQKGDAGKKIDDDIEKLKTHNDDLLAGIKNAKGLMTSGSANSVVYVNDVSSRSGADIQSLAQKVSDIVMEVVKTDDTPQLCFTQLNRENADAKIRDYCEKLFETAIKNKQLTAEFATKLLNTATTQEDVIKAWNAFNGTQQKVEDSGATIKDANTKNKDTKLAR